MPRGRPRRLPTVSCPDRRHAGSHVKANGTRQLKSGLRRRYVCTPTGYPAHGFTVWAELAEEQPTPQYAPPPACPRHGVSGRVVRYGRYGRAGEVPRQRYRCYPPSVAVGEKPFHTFTPPLAREHVHAGEAHCEECEELRGIHRGEQVAGRTQSWNLRVVAQGLAKLAAGDSYTAVGTWAWAAEGRTRTRPAKLSAAERSWRERARAARQAGEPVPPRPKELLALDARVEPAPRRHRVTSAGEPLPARKRTARTKEANNRWHIAADWVEMYAPVLWEPLHSRLLDSERVEHARRAAMTSEQRLADGRPSVLLLDDVPVQTRAVSDGSGRRVSRRSYFLLAAATVEWPAGAHSPDPGDRYTQLRLLRAYANNSAAAWKLLLHELGYRTGEYEPEFVIADAGTGLRKAVEEYLPATVFVPSLWHASEAVTLALQRTPGAQLLTDEGPALHPELLDHVAWLSATRIREMSPLQWAGWWNDLDALLDRLHLAPEQVHRRRLNYEKVIADMLVEVQRNPGVPLSTGGFETVLRSSAKRMLASRGHGFANIERTNSLCDLVVCRDRGVFTRQSHVVTRLRDAATRHSGWASAPRESADPQPPMPAVYSSLRDPDIIDTLARKRGLA